MKCKNYLVVLLSLAVSIFAEAQKKKEIVRDPLPSWNEGAPKKSIIDFVTKTTKKESPDFIPVADRIACFDNDGTLWSEQPLYFQLAFALDEVKALAPEHPEWKTTQPFQAVLEGDLQTAFSDGVKSILQIVMASHVGLFCVSFLHHAVTGQTQDSMTVFCFDKR